MDMQNAIQTMNQGLGLRLKELTPDIQQCIETCLKCAHVCQQIVPYCLEKGGEHGDRLHIQQLLVCAETCRTAASFMMWGSEYHDRQCGICADVCLDCADDCDELADDEMTKLCATICRECAASCRKMAMAH